MKKLATILAGAALVIGMATGAYAIPTIDMGIIAPTTGSISYAGGLAPLIGTGISLDKVNGLDTPLNSGDPGYNLINAVLSFQTGNYIGGDANSWNFGGGSNSFISVYGTVDVNNNNIVDTGDITGLLLYGSFGTASVNELSSTFSIAGASFSDFKNEDLLELFGLPNIQYAGNFNISFDGKSLVGSNGFESERVLSGDVTNSPVPEPGTMVLLGAGLLGLAIYGKRRMNKEV